MEAFGIQLLNSEGKPLETFWESIWLRVAKLRGKLYRLPGGAIGEKITATLPEEWTCFANIWTNLFVFHLSSFSEKSM